MTGFTGSLKLRIAPFPDESILGLVVRLAERNALDSAGWLWPLCGWNTHTLSNLGSADLQRLARLGGWSPQDLVWRQATPLPEKRRRFFGTWVYANQLAFKRRRVCVGCLREAAYQRALWDLRDVDACAKHGLPLIGRCPVCRRALSWRDADIARCRRCVHDLRDFRLPSLDPQHLGGIRAIERHCAAALAHECSCPGHADLALGDWIRLLTRLVALRPGHPPRRGNYGCGDFHLLNIGWKIYCAWPQALFDIADRHRSLAAQRKGRYGHSKEFGTLHSAISDLPDTAYGRFIREGFHRYLETRPDPLLSFRMKVDDVEPDGDGAYYTQTAVASALGVHNTVVRFLAHAFGVAGQTRGHGSGAPILFRREEIEVFRGVLSRLIGPAEVRARLGVSKPLFHALLQAGIVRPLPSPPGDRRRIAAFDRGEIDQLLATLRRHVHRRARKGYGAPLGLAAGMLRVPQIYILQAVLDGQVAVLAECMAEKGMAKGLTIDVTQAAKVVRERWGYSVGAVAEFLLISWQDAAALMKGGELPTVLVGPRGGRLARREDLEAFKARYVSANDLYSKMGIPAQACQDFLKAHRVRPCRGGGFDKVSCRYYERAAVERALTRSGRGESRV